MWVMINDKARIQVLDDCKGNCGGIQVRKFCNGDCKGDRSGRLQEIPQLIIVYEILLQPTSRRFLRELDEAFGGNNLHYILQCLRIPALVTRVWTRKVCWVATECSWNDGSKTQYYVVILDQLQGCSGGLERALEWCVRDPLTETASEIQVSGCNGNCGAEYK